MKKFFSALMVLFAVAIFLPAMTCEAMEPAPVTQLKDIIGNWYDAKGNLVLTISNDYKINGCSVMSLKYAADTAGVYEIRINEGTGYRDIELLHNGSKNSYHEMLVLNWRKNNALALRRTKEPQYFESVGGIYLGMDKDEVLKRYGNPSSIDTKFGIWKYDDLGLEVHVEWNVVTGITIYPHGDRKFDWSGLSARSSQADFEYKYNGSVSRGGSIKIGPGEVIRIKRLNRIRVENDGVYLGILDPGYRFL